MIISRKISAFSVELMVGMLVGNYWLPVVTGGAEPQEGGEIARALVWYVYIPRRRLVLTGPVIRGFQYIRELYHGPDIGPE